jgi:hypothetical protein
MADEGYMKRGKAQVLFNYLPDNTFDYTGKTGIHKVKSLDVVQRSDLDTEYIGRQVLNKVRAWHANEYGAVGYPDYPDSFQLVEPREVNTSLFPLLFRCTTCERIHSYRDAEELATYNRSFRCKSNGCSGSIQQHQFLFIHECGEIRSPYPGQCNQCGSYDDWAFETYGSQRFRNAEWRCKNCQNTKDLEAWCDCDLPSSRMQPTVHRASSAYQPHHITVINVGHQVAGDASDPRFAKSAMAKYLDLTDDPINSIDLDSRRVSDEREEKEWQLRQYRDMYETSGANQIKEEIQRLESELEEMDEGGAPIGTVVADLVPALNTENDLPESAQQSVVDVFQYLNLTEELERRTAREVILESGSDSSQSRQRRELRADRVDSQADDLGISEISFVEDFPITNVVFGYTRINREPDDSRLIGFNEGQVDSSGDGTPIFVDTVETEGVQVDLDPKRVLSWLLHNTRRDDDTADQLRQAIVESDLPGERTVPVGNDWSAGTVDEWLEGTTITPGEVESIEHWDETDARAWIVSNVGEIPSFERMVLESDSDDEGANAITYFVYHLLHSYSHLVLKHATQLSGISRTSLAEFLMPRSLSFVFYSNQRTDFNIGALYTLVESSLRDLLGEMTARGDDCVYDPVCSREGAACHNCLHLSEVSCVHFNRNLGRDFVYGSKSTTEKDITGYIEV